MSGEDLVLTMGLDSAAVKKSLANVVEESRKAGRQISKDWIAAQDETRKANEEFYDKLSKGAMIALAGGLAAIAKSFSLVREAAAEAVKLGSVTGLTIEQIRTLTVRAEEIDGAFTRLKSITGLWASDLTTRLTPAIESVAKALVDLRNGSSFLDRIKDQFVYTPGKGFGAGGQALEEERLSAQVGLDTEARHRAEAAAELARETHPGALTGKEIAAQVKAYFDRRKAEIAAWKAERDKRIKEFNEMMWGADGSGGVGPSSREFLATQRKNISENLDAEQRAYNRKYEMAMDNAFRIARLQDEADDRERDRLFRKVSTYHETFSMIGDELASVVTQAAQALGSGDTENLAGRVIGGVIQMIGSLLVEMGTFAIVAGTLGTIIPALLPLTGGPVAIAMGVGAVGVGGAIIAAGAALGGSTPTPAATPPGLSGSGPRIIQPKQLGHSDFSLDRPGEALYVSVNFNGPVGGSPRRIGREIASLLQENRSLRGRSG